MILRNVFDQCSANEGVKLQLRKELPQSKSALKESAAESTKKRPTPQ